ncbi:ABC transporter ATP-binding protein [Kutzneria sp. 744]|uniref:ABC transporter ATP-binding protein n=1 Tax=Kutzneria sp. (strain 744) TaxID=345341 RepID=UPI0003EEB27F|nr:ABC transporter ATP-binding protein [Kutzneria sp. 744]EWM17186.1 ABC transporter ATP-binding protein [Kutzneria sp. 744]
MSTPALCAAGLSKHFGRVRALDDCTFDLPEGRVIALVGPNGAGKSTLLSLASGLIRPTAGSISVHGTPVRGRMHPDVAYLAQNRPLYPDFTVREVIQAVGAMNERWSQPRVEEVLDMLAGVDRDAKVRALSAGARTQVAIALALGRLPKVLLLDEPLSDLDPLARDETLRIVMTEVADRGTTVLMSSHLLSDLSEVCDHLLLVVEGQVRLNGDVEDVLAEHRVLVGPRDDESAVSGVVVSASRAERQATLLVRGADPVPAGWVADRPDLESLVVGYLRAARERAAARR